MRTGWAGQTQKLMSFGLLPLGRLGLKTSADPNEVTKLESGSDTPNSIIKTRRGVG